MVMHAKRGKEKQAVYSGLLIYRKKYYTHSYYIVSEYFSIQ